MCCAMWSIFTLSVFSAAFILPSGHEASVFYSSREANQVLKIQKRANSFLEELKQGSLERECREEVCDFEEASEIFETKEATQEFWTKYVDGDMCESSPCDNGSCRDGIGQFDCICNKGWEGRQCQYVVAYTNCSISNGGCEHFCNEGQQDNDQYRYCSCASGYRLADDSTSCEPVVEFACGKVQDFSYKTAKVIGGRPGRKGQSPWQVMLSNSAGRFLCGGVLIHPTWVLTAAHCLKSLRTVKLTFGKYYRRRTEESEQTIFADKLLPHENYSEQTSENDIALLHLQRPVLVNKFTIPICLPSKKLAEHLEREETQAVVTGWGSQSEDSKVNYSSVLNYIEIPVAPRNDCVNSMLNTVSENMLCAGILGDNRDSCHGDSGGPMITKFKNTWFLIGLVSWGEGCGATDNFGIYTRVSAYFDWIYQQMKDSILSPNPVPVLIEV